MKIKTIFIVVITALITIILMKNTDSVEFWIFGVYYIQKLVILATMFVLGIIVGLVLGKGNRKKRSQVQNEQIPSTNPPLTESDRHLGSPENTLSEEDRDYIN